MNSTPETNELIDILKNAMEDKKAENIKTIYIGEISSITDFFIIASVSNPAQLEAVVDNITDELIKNGFSAKRTEGNRNSGWVLMDLGDVIVHVFLREEREYYNLERIWKDGVFL